MNEQVVCAAIESMRKKHDDHAARIISMQLSESRVFDARVIIDYMHYAAKNNCVRVIRAIHAVMPSAIDIIDSTGKTPLFNAAQYGCVDVILLLGELGTRAYLLVDGFSEITPLEVAIFHNRSEAIKALIQIGCTLNMTTQESAHLLLLQAARLNFHEIVETLHSIDSTLIDAHGQDDFHALGMCIGQNSDTDATTETICRLRPRLVDTPIFSTRNILPMHVALATSYPKNIRTMLILHRYGSEGHMERTASGEIPGQDIDYENVDTETVLYRVRNVYFSRSLLEVLYFSLSAIEFNIFRRL